MMPEPRPYQGLTKEGKWVKGNFCNLAGLSYISEYPVGAGFNKETKCKTISGWLEVIPSTVGQSTGKKDIKDIEIFEGDKLKIGNFPDSCSVFWDNEKAAFYTTTLKGNIGPRLLGDFTWSFHNITEVIGNIHQNPMDCGKD